MGNSCRTEQPACPASKYWPQGVYCKQNKSCACSGLVGQHCKQLQRGKGCGGVKTTVYIQNREHSRCVHLNGRRAQVWIQGVVLLLSACVSWVSGWSRCLKPGFISRTQVPYDISGLLLNLCVYILLILPWLFNCLSRTLENLKINYRSAKWYYLAILLPMFLYVKKSFDSSVII